MNAYKLADELDACANETMDSLFKNKTGASSLLWNIKVTDVEQRKNAATMLRQQADRIAELEKDADYKTTEYPWYDQDVSSKPVAWFVKENGIYWEVSDEHIGDKDLIPLYTHPVKQLSDEEIDKITLQFWERPFVEAHRNFARAIIKEITE